MPVAHPERTLEPEPERGLLLAVLPHGADDESELAELGELARAAGVAPVAQVVQHRARSDPRTYVGKGKLAELKGTYAESRAEVLLVDEELKPTQQRALEDALSARSHRAERRRLVLIEAAIELLDWHELGEVALVPVERVRHLLEPAIVLGEVRVEIVERLLVRLHAPRLRVGEVE